MNRYIYRAGAVALASIATWACVTVAARDREKSVTTARELATAGVSVGPDVIVSSISGVRAYGSEDPNGDGNLVAAFSVGTTSCNIGDTALEWVERTAAHPVIRQSLYRLKNNRFEQIGSSWVKHGFLALNNRDLCTGECVTTGAPFDELRPGCSDPYVAGLNGTRRHLGPTSDINAFTGVFPYPPTISTTSGNIGNRAQVLHTDLDAALNIGALYFAEGHYVAADDAQAGNGVNNTSYRKVDIVTDEESGFCDVPYCAFLNGANIIEVPALTAWKTADNSVRETPAEIPNEGVFLLAAKVIDLNDGFWRYEYALHNMNSDRAGGSFSMPLPEGAVVRNIGFHDINHHSGEPWDGTDWVGVHESGQITWATTPFDDDPNANALRWGTLFNFRFEINAPPEDGSVILGLFKPGFPDEVAIRTDTPRLGFIDCNDNGISDDCDVSCEVLGCDQNTCGQSEDCNNNGIPDDPLCEPDCNGNEIPDSCDIRDCPVGELWCGDCNGNTVPDGCEDDCDGDGIPDTCELVPDSDGDGVDDCDDLCPETTPVGACLPTLLVSCCYPNGLCICSGDVVRTTCINAGGTPVCGRADISCIFWDQCPESNCRDGCLMGDFNGDGDVDLDDNAALQMCFSAEIGAVAFVPPTPECLLRFDFDDDGDVDLDDVFDYTQAITGP